MTKTAIVTGITGQDGAYLAENLLARGYVVHGTCRSLAAADLWRVEELGIRDHARLSVVEYDFADTRGAIELIERAGATEVYNLAAQSFVGSSFDQPITTGRVTGLGCACLLEAIRTVDPAIRFYQASTSEMFGRARAVPQTEETPFYPRNPYGIAKLYAHWMTVNYRESFGLFGASGILFNHESPLRGAEFVTRKITDTVARIALGQAEVLEIGNLDAERDWGYAKDYVEGMRLMLQHDRPETFVLATNRTATVRRFVECAFSEIGVALAWSGEAAGETGTDCATGRLRVRVNPAFYRPAEPDRLVGDPARAKSLLGWEATVRLDELIRLMVAADLRRNDPAGAAGSRP